MGVVILHMIFKDMRLDMIIYTVAVKKKKRVLSPGALQYLEVKGMKRNQQRKMRRNQ